MSTDCLELDVLLAGIVDNLRKKRNDLIHSGYKTNIFASVHEIIPFFEVFMFNIKSFFVNLENFL